MKNKKIIIITVTIFVLLVVLTLWLSGIIPKQIAIISAKYHIKRDFPKMQLEYVDIEWNSAFNGYSIKFKDENNKIYGFLMQPKYFPVSFGQGIFAFEEDYRLKYGDQEEREEYYKNRLESIPKRLSVQDAVNRGFFVYDCVDNKIYNKNILDRFVKNTEMNATNRVEDEITIVIYSMNEEPTIYNLLYNEDGYVLVKDNSRVYTYETQELSENADITVNTDIPKEYYGITITEDEGIMATIISLTYYKNNAKESKYKDIEVARYSIDAEML